uniref:Dihydropteroate synthase n=1 Tax=uncultured Acidobacteriales bacterium HF0200_23L05 TaxID=710732 RepID=E0XUI2_9BACT|nr:dihydropteroate synthase and related enzymes [uncultured Acidobacteriales bacterium HF0200_23L05]
MMAIRKPYSLSLPGGTTLGLGERTRVMGIINVTPDSFADGGDCFVLQRAVDRALELEDAGADILDVGGESTRPGAAPLSVEEELRRVIPVIEQLIKRVGIPISIDSYKGSVAEAALDLGAVIVNDISGLSYDPLLASVISKRGVPVILMHNRGRSQQMYREASYENVGREIVIELRAAIERAVNAGIAREQIVVDPGLGFAKHARHSTAALADLPVLNLLDRPILVGASRKSFLESMLGARSPQDREWGTAGAVAVAAFLGAHIIRVHDVSVHHDVVRVVDTLRSVSVKR